MSEQWQTESVVATNPREAGLADEPKSSVLNGAFVPFAFFKQDLIAIRAPGLLGLAPIEQAEFGLIKPLAESTVQMSANKCGRLLAMTVASNHQGFRHDQAPLFVVIDFEGDRHVPPSLQSEGHYEKSVISN